MEPRRLLSSAGFAVVYAVATVLGRLTVLEGSTMNLVWPAAGVSALWLLLHRTGSGRRLDATLLVCTTALVNLATGVPVVLAVFLGGLALLQPLLFVWLFRRCTRRGARDGGPRLTDLRSLGALLLSIELSSTVCAVLGTTALQLTVGSVSLLDLAVWQTRNGVAMLLVVPLGLTVRQLWVEHHEPRATPVRPRGWRAVEMVVAMTATLVAHVVVFVLLPTYPVAFPLYALTAWVALRFATVLTTVRNLLAAVLAVAWTLAGSGPFAQVADVAARALVVQVYAAMGAALGLALALSRDERLVLLDRARRSAAEATERAHQVEVLANASRQVLSADDPRTAICQAVQEVSGADGVYLLEPDGNGHLTSTAAVGIHVPPVSLDADPATSLTAWAFHRGQPVFVPDIFTEPRVSLTVIGQFGITSAAWQPAILADGQVVAVITLVWREGAAALPTTTGQVLAMLGAEAARAIDRGNLLEQLARAADRDQLTGLANRRRWDEMAAVEVSRAQRNRLPLSLLMLDLDHFKAYNDTYGHSAGDDLLRDFAAAAAACLRDGDLIARWGGEEFAVALPDCSLEEARLVAGRILAAVPHHQTATIGIAQWRRGETTADALGRADAALYQGKRNGRARAVIAAHTDPTQTTDDNHDTAYANHLDQIPSWTPVQRRFRTGS